MKQVIFFKNGMDVSIPYTTTLTIFPFTTMIFFGGLPLSWAWVRSSAKIIFPTP